LKRFLGKASSMHLVSCRHKTSGRTALMNLATRSMRSRTELMFQVVRESRIEAFMIVIARSASDEAIQRTGNSGLPGCRSQRRLRGGA